MTVCKIFATFAAVDEIDNETDALVEEIKTQLEKDRKKDRIFSIESEKREMRAQDKHCETSTFILKFRSSGSLKGKPRSAALTLHFDYIRDDSESKWPHAKQALLVVGYAYLTSDPWLCNELFVHSSGRLENSDICDSLSAKCNERLLVGTANEDGHHLSEKNWVFAVPLAALNSPEAVERNVTEPILTLLLSRQPDKAFSKSQAIAWEFA